MGRTGVYSITGAIIGFLAAFPIIWVMSGGETYRDTAAITLFVGTFLAGSGAIAGAITGATQEFVRRRDQSDDPPTA